MKNEHLATIFASLVGLAMLGIWYYSSNSSLQVGGALYGIPGADPITPMMAVLIVVWFLLVGSVIHLHKPKK